MTSSVESKDGRNHQDYQPGPEWLAAREHANLVCPFEATVGRWQSITVAPAGVEPPTRTKTVPASCFEWPPHM